MTDYIERRESIQQWLGNDPQLIAAAMANRYIGANPAIPHSYRVFSENGIMQTAEGLYDLNLAARLPLAQAGQYAYAYGLVWSDDDRSIDTLMLPFGPVRLYLNDEMLYRSTAVEELLPGAKVIVPVLFRKGWNTFLIEAVNTEAGFGCLFGAVEAKVRIMNVLSPFEDRAGTAGWVYSHAVSTRVYGIDNGMPDYRFTEEASGLHWLPELEWPKQKLDRPNCERIFGLPEQRAVAYSWTRLSFEQTKPASVWSGKVHGATTIWLDGQLILELTPAESGSFSHEIVRNVREGELLVRTESSEHAWGFELAIHASDGEQARFELPVPVHGASAQQTWLHVGPLAANAQLSPSEVQTMKRLFACSERSSGSESIRNSGHTYWSLDGPGMRVRPYYENAMLSNKWTTSGVTNFGRWDYPLGVTMYGLLRTARVLKREDIAQYAHAHIASCTEMYDYSLWDKEQYGFPSVNHQLVVMRMLDNSGSFGSAMLEAYLGAERQEEQQLRIAGVIADFIEHRLERREDGAYYRLCAGEYSADTMWADDLYMSTPFLCRYYRATGQRSYIDDAARQFLLYRQYLFLPISGVMSHVYDFKYNKATGVPWGRGNGWCLFSLSELLELMPEDHLDRPELLAFFEELCAGILVLQGESGLWHQVLTHPDAYEEASCTAMFVYAFARGVRFGWLEKPAAYEAAACKGWRGLISKAIDRQGNVHGVCSGSRYSYSADYYKYDLLTVLNDNHGIGIMLLAGVEMASLAEAMCVQKPAAEASEVISHGNR